MVTTILIVRHAEYDPSGGNDPSLNATGRVRAQKLADFLFNSGVKVIYRTRKKRTQETVMPLAEVLMISPRIYIDDTSSDINNFVEQILSDHAGKVILIAGHSNTVPIIIDALLGYSANISIGNEFHNLFIVTIHGTSKAVLKLQYCKPPTLCLIETGGFQGTVFERLPTGGIGPKIRGARITFASEGSNVIENVTSSVNGYYRIALSKGRYVVTANHLDFETYSSSPGFFVVTGKDYQIGNIFMKKRL